MYTLIIIAFMGGNLTQLQVPDTMTLEVCKQVGQAVLNGEGMKSAYDAHFVCVKVK